MFPDDLTVATGRPEACIPGHSNAEDAVGALRNSINIAPRIERFVSTMGLRAGALASSVIGAQGSTIPTILPLIVHLMSEKCLVRVEWPPLLDQRSSYGRGFLRNGARDLRDSVFLRRRFGR